MPTERLAPSSIEASSNYTAPLVTAIDDDPDSPDGLWLAATDNGTDSDVRVAMANPSAALQTGTGLQEVRVLVRKSATGGTDPSATVELWQSGALVSALISGTTVTSTTGTVLSATFTAPGTDGSGIEFRVLGSRSGGSPANRRTIELGAIEWNAQTADPAIIATLSAQETGADTFSAVGTVSDPAISAVLAAQESGTDTFTATGRAIIGAAITAQEAGQDSLAATGAVIVSGALAAQEVGADTFAATLSTASGAISATLSAQEAGQDTASIAGKVIIGASASMTESGQDAFAATITRPTIGAGIAAQEAGTDSLSAAAKVIVAATLAAQEVGQDTFRASSAVPVVKGKRWRKKRRKLRVYLGL